MRLEQRASSAVPGSPDPFGNRLLAALPEHQRMRLGAAITLVELRREEFTHVHGAPLRHVDFPIDAVMSVVATLENGSTCEVATVGREAFVEIDAALGSRIAQRSSFCQAPGYVARLSLETFRSESEAGREFRTLALRAVRARAFMTEQLAACNLKHTLVERFARWLLMARDRMRRTDFNVTHDFLAMMLGARRAGVSQAAATLQGSGSIAYRRGRMMILDDGALERDACECYALSRDAIELCFATESNTEDDG